MALWLPTFSTDLVKRRLHLASGDDRGNGRCAILLTRTVGGREVVARLCVRSAMAGVRPGIDLAQARAMIPRGVTLHTCPHRPDRDAHALQRLACWALRISPTVSPESPDGLLLDLTGTTLLYGREERVARSASRAVARLGFRVRTAIASTYTCASAVARWGETTTAVVPGGDERAAFAALHVAALSDDAATLEGMDELGIDRVEQVLALPRRQLASRFGLEVLARIDRALGHATETVNPVHPLPPIRSELLFDGPTDRYESVEAATRDVLGDLVKQLTNSQRGVRRLDCAILRPGGASDRVVVELSRPSINPKHLWSLLRTRLEKVDMGAMVEGLEITATRTARLRGRQLVHARLGGADEQSDDAQAAIGELTDTLVNRLGQQNVLRVALRASHLPEQCVSVHSVMEASPVSAVLPPRQRPTVLFPTPVAADVLALTPDGPVLELGWRGTGDKREQVAACFGPERVGPEWWRWRGTLDAPLRTAPPPDRDYFTVQLASGPWLWVCRQVGHGRGRWFVHGEWG